MYWSEAEAQFYFQLTLAGIAVVAAVSIALTVALCRRAERRHKAHLDRLLALPSEDVEVYVWSYVAQSENGDYLAHILYSRVRGEDAAILARDESTMKALCSLFENAGRPVKNVPPMWLDFGKGTNK